MHLSLILYASLLRKRYLRKGIDALGENYEMLVSQESPENSKDTEAPTLTATIIHKSFIKRVFPSNKIS